MTDGCSGLKGTMPADDPHLVRYDAVRAPSVQGSEPRRPLIECWLRRYDFARERRTDTSPAESAPFF